MPLFDPELTEDEILTAINQDSLSELNKLAEGGQGAVWKCMYNSSLCALKIYPLNRSHKLRIDREINSLRSLSSEYIVSLFHYGETTIRNIDCIYYISEFIKGEELGNILRNGTLSNEEAIALITEIGTAISELWQNRIVHRDIKPNNIIKSDDKFVLIDLGIARHLNETTITPPNHALGTWGYMSPEQYKGRNGLTLRSDFFTLGIVAYEAITGVHPFSRRQDLIGEIEPFEMNLDESYKPGTLNCIKALLNNKIYDRPISVKEIKELIEG